MRIAVSIVPGALPPLDAARAEGPHDCGARVIFEGVVRDLEEGVPIAALDYEAYRPMADRELERLAASVGVRFGARRVFVEHSVGEVPVGERSFRLVVHAPHRAEALRAVEAFVDAMKRDVPIWKRAVSRRSTTSCAPAGRTRAR